jgi:hypothetical protein
MLTMRSCLLAIALGCFAGAEPAVADPGAGVQDDYQNQYSEGATARAHGALHGVVAAVDYGQARIEVETRDGRFRVAVLPSTTIFRGKSGYATLADLVPGAYVDVSVSEVGGQLVAQIIRIK